MNIIKVKIEILRDYKRKKRFLYCEAHADDEHVLVEKLEIPAQMPDETALHYGKNLFYNSLMKKGYRIKANDNT